MPTASLPILYWGGQPIRELHRSREFPESALNTFRRWEGFLTDPGTLRDRYLDFVRGGGRTWLDVPMEDGSGRLFVRPIYVTDLTARPLWNFLAVAIPGVGISGLPYTQFLLALARMEPKRLVTGLAPGENAKIIAEATEEPAETFDLRRGSGAGTLAGSLGECLTAWATTQGTSTVARSLRGGALACNPPNSHPDFAGLLLVKDFPLPGLTVITAPVPSTPAAVEPKKLSLAPEASASVSRPPLPPEVWVLGRRWDWKVRGCLFLLVSSLLLNLGQCRRVESLRADADQARGKLVAMNQKLADARRNLLDERKKHSQEVQKLQNELKTERARIIPRFERPPNELP